MTDELILVLDAGTGGGRAVAVDRKGKVRARSYRAWDYFEPPGLEMYAKEFHPEEFQKIIAGCCRRVIGEAGAANIAGVVATGMREGIVLLDRDGQPIYGGPNRDARGVLFAPQVEELLGEDRAYQITGHWPPWIFMPSRLYWFRENAPEKFARIGRALMINDWLIHWLSGEAVAEPTNAGETMLFDIDARAWSRELLTAMGIDESMMPRIAPCGAVAGAVTKSAAAATGLPEGTRVITAMADTQAALMASRVIEQGDCGIVAGSTAPVMIVMDQSRRDPHHRMWFGAHPLPGRWVAESNVGDAGLIYRWYVEGHLGAMAAAGAPLYEKAEEWAQSSGVGAYGARAFLGPVIWDLKSMSPSVKAGLKLSYPVGPDTAGPGNFARAILENIAFALRANLEQAAVVAGDPARVAMAGGMTRNKLFCNIVAAVLGRTIEIVPESEATAIGAAMAGFTAIGIYPGLAVASKEMTGYLRDIEPDSDEKEEYNDLFEEWMSDYPRMMGFED
ncbi:MAG TPA: FGGY-family carbohydrate kinase [bacterium]|nr:FGGY-family carbohydrate kinase [bacterium]